MRHTLVALLLSSFVLLPVLPGWERVMGSRAGAQPITLERPVDEPPVPRLRIGAELGGGVTYGAVESGSLGLFGQIGAQITRQLGLFYQPSLLGYGFGRDSDGALQTFLVSSHSAMVDLTFDNVAQVGIGGGLDFGSFAYCDEDKGMCFQTGRSVNPSMSIRAAFLVGFVRNRARWGVPIALQVHTMLWDHRSLNHLMLTVGFSRY